MRPFDARMLIIQALSEARMVILRLKSVYMLLEGQDSIDRSIPRRLLFVVKLMEGIAGELEKLLDLPRLDPSKVLALLEASRIALAEARGVHPDVEHGISLILNNLAHIYSIASEEGYSRGPDTSLINSLVEEARKAAGDVVS